MRYHIYRVEYENRDTSFFSITREGSGWNPEKVIPHASKIRKVHTFEVEASEEAKSKLKGYAHPSVERALGYFEAYQGNDLTEPHAPNLTDEQLAVVKKERKAGYDLGIQS